MTDSIWSTTIGRGLFVSTWKANYGKGKHTKHLNFCRPNEFYELIQTRMFQAIKIVNMRKNKTQIRSRNNQKHGFPSDGSGSKLSGQTVPHLFAVSHFQLRTGMWYARQGPLEVEHIWVLNQKSGENHPNHPILIGFSLINHPFWGTTIFGNTHIKIL